MAKILVVEDYADERASIKETLQEHSHEVFEAADVESARAELDANTFDIVLIDMRMPPSNRTQSVDRKAGIAVIDRAMQQEPSPICIVMTAYGSVENMVEVIQEGAWDYIEKPFSEKRLLISIDSTLKQQEFEPLSPSVTYQRERLIGGSEKMIECHRLISIAAQNDVTVLIRGESGTGKDLVARSIHYDSLRRLGPFIPVSCSAIPRELLESELFGHKKGAFTEASYDRSGAFGAAEKGTIFLDEIGDMPMDMQTKLLRVLQEKMIKRIGEEHECPVDVRVIAATNRDIEQAMKDGNFREDLYFRLNVFPITIPSLRERKEDIPLLVAHFLEKHSEKFKEKKSISDKSMNLLYEYDWPGNVRELEHAIERAIMLAESPVIQPSELSLQGPISSSDKSSRWHNEPEKDNQEVSEQTPTSYSLDAWYLWIKAQAGNGRQIDYDNFKRYVVIRATGELTASSQNLKWTEVGKKVGLEGKRVREVIEAIVSELKENRVTSIEEIQKGQAGDFVNQAIKYYTEKLSGN